MCNAKPQCFLVSGKNFTGNHMFQGNIYLKDHLKIGGVSWYIMRCHLIIYMKF